MEKLKPCPFRIHGERVQSATAEGEFYYNETFMPCIGNKCACYADIGDEIRCYRENVCFILWWKGEETCTKKAK